MVTGADPSAWRVRRRLNLDALPDPLFPKAVAPDLRHIVVASEETPGVHTYVAWMHELIEHKKDTGNLVLGPRTTRVKCRASPSDYLWLMGHLFVCDSCSHLSVYDRASSAVFRLPVPHHADSYVMHPHPDALVLDMRGADGRRKACALVVRQGEGWVVEPQRDLPWLWERMCDDSSRSHDVISQACQSPYIPALYVGLHYGYDRVKLYVSLETAHLFDMGLDGQPVGWLCVRSPTWMTLNTLALQLGRAYWVVEW